MSRRLATALSVLCFFLEFVASTWTQAQSGESWHFAVSGDSRNCGDVVMPAIAQDVVRHNAAFYWHLGDFRAMYGVDEDMQERYGPSLTLEEYRQIAWSDFIVHQVEPFGAVPVRLGIGNHETIGKSADDYLSQFGYWLDTPELREQRVKDNPQDSSLKPYYHWKERNVDFIYLDNSGDDGFSETQLGWFERVLDNDKKDPAVRTLVVGMHRALPNSLACGHSMNGDLKTPSEKGKTSGRRAYGDLAQWKQETKKYVYVLASHSHFYMQDLYDTAYWQNPEHGGEILPGWIVGTAGAMRYRLPDLPADVLAKAKAETYVWGYLLGTVTASGEIDFRFVRLGKEAVPEAVRLHYGDKFVDGVCFDGNKDDTPHPPPDSCNDK